MSLGLQGGYLFDVFVFASVYPVKENVADGVNQVSSELSHAALSLSRECGLRVVGGVFLQGRPCLTALILHVLAHVTLYACPLQMQQKLLIVL